MAKRKKTTKPKRVPFGGYRLEMDVKLLNCIRLNRILEEELYDKKATPNQVASMIYAQRLLAEMLLERLDWAFGRQYPGSKFDLGAIEPTASFEDPMPEALRQAEKRFREAFL